MVPGEHRCTLGACLARTGPWAAQKGSCCRGMFAKHHRVAASQEIEEDYMKARRVARGGLVEGGRRTSASCPRVPGNRRRLIAGGENWNSPLFTVSWTGVDGGVLAEGPACVAEVSADDGLRPLVSRMCRHAGAVGTRLLIRYTPASRSIQSHAILTHTKVHLPAHTQAVRQLPGPSEQPGYPYSLSGAWGAWVPQAY